MLLAFITKKNAILVSHTHSDSCEEIVHTCIDFGNILEIKTRNMTSLVPILILIVRAITCLTILLFLT